jgi:hypothetical protein
MNCDDNIKLDTSTFESTAKVLFEINDSVKEKYLDWQGLMGFMEHMAWTYNIRGGSGFFSTSGFCLTAFDTDVGERHVVATVMTYTASEYVKTVDDRIKELEDQVTEARDAYDAVLSATLDLPSHERSWGWYTSRCDINQYILQPMNRQVKEWNPVDHPELLS